MIYCKHFLFILVFFVLTSPVFAITMQEYWDGSAYFQKITQWNLGIQGTNIYKGANLQADIVVKNGVWYRFSRQFIPSKPIYCQMDVAEVLVSESYDKGITWSVPFTVVSPQVNTPWECAAIDGDAYWDQPTNTWHYIFQCLGRDNVWNLCYTKRIADTPMGQFDQPVLSVAAGSIWKTLMGKSWADEGTPEIVQKIGNNYYVTFHGFDGVRGYRGIARTTDFLSWAVDTTNPIYGPDTCSIWNVMWGSGGCVGAGEAGVLIDGGYYYQVIESMDKSLICMQDQNWVYGIMRTKNLTVPIWEYISGNQIGIVYSTKQPTVAGYGSPCAVQYVRLFRDGSDIYFIVGRVAELPNINDDPITGIYLYKLVQKAPFADYRFREGHQLRTYVQSDTVSRGNTEGKLENIQWLDSPQIGIFFNGLNSQMSLPANEGVPKSAPVSISVDIQLQSLPSGNTLSQFIAGKRGSYWIELYQSGNICAFVYETTGTYKNACARAPIGVRTNVTLTASTTTLQLGLNATYVASTAIGQIQTNTNPFTVGSLGQTDQGYYGSFNGFLYRLQLFTNVISLDVPIATLTPIISTPTSTKVPSITPTTPSMIQPTHTPTPTPKKGDFTNDGMVNSADLFYTIRNFVSIFLYNTLVTYYGK